MWTVFRLKATAISAHWQGLKARLTPISPLSFYLLLATHPDNRGKTTEALRRGALGPDYKIINCGAVNPSRGIYTIVAQVKLERRGTTDFDQIRGELSAKLESVTGIIKYDVLFLE